MRKIRFYLGIGYVGAEHEEVFEFDDYTSDEEIEEYYKDWVDNYLDSGWNEEFDYE